MKGFFSQNLAGSLFLHAGLRPMGFLIVLFAFVAGCHSGEADTKPPEPSSSSDSGNSAKSSKEETKTPSPEMPAFVVFKNWQMSDAANSQTILAVYRSWDSGNTDSMAINFGDSVFYDFPDGTRLLTTKKTVEAKFKKWRHEFTETSNIPFSLISVYNKDRDQQWVIAWTWNKWRYADGKKDSALYCDNWRFRDGKIVYLNSLQNKTSKALAARLNANIPR